MRLNIAHKFSIFAILLVIFTTSIAAYLFFQDSRNTIIQHTLEQITYSVSEKSSIISAHINHVSEDILFLAQSPLVLAHAQALRASQGDARTNTRLAQLERDIAKNFLAIAQAKEDYAQIRIIDTSGHERVRVQGEEFGNFYIVKESLQDKSDRAYVKETLALPANSIYISEISLNHEHGVIALPFQPVIRVAMPIYLEKATRPSSMVVINLDLGLILSQLNNTFLQDGHPLYVTDETGSFLIHPEASHLYGTDLRHGINLITEFPQLSSLIDPQRNIDRFQQIRDSEYGKQITVFKKIYFVADNTSRFLNVGIAEVNPDITKLVRDVFLDNIRITVITAIIAILLALIFAKRFTNPINLIIRNVDNFEKNLDYDAVPEKGNDELVQLSYSIKTMMDSIKQNQKELENLNQNLERQVEERTVELSDSKRLLITVLNNIPARVYWKDLNLHYLGCNQLFAKDIGITRPNDVIGKDDSAYPLANFSQERVNEDKEVINTGKAILSREINIVHDNGDEQWLEFGKIPLIDNQDMTIGLLGIYSDISERKHSEERLRLTSQNLSQFKTTLDLTEDCVFIFNTDLIFTYVNQGAVKQVGYSEEELLQMSPYDIIPEYDELDFNTLIQPLLSRKKSVLSFETTHQHKNGNWVPVDISLQYIHPQGQAARFIALARDITNRKRVDKLKSDFISTVSHELRTPLTSIRGALGLINGGMLGELPEKAVAMLNIANSNTERLLLLINDILDIQKIESGDIRFDFCNAHLTPLLEQAVNDNTGYANEFGITLALDIQLEDDQIYADGDRIMQVLNNLASNAIKFSPSGGEVKIVATQRDDTLRVSVIDNGMGIPDEFKPHVFQKFAQADSGNTRNVSGTGLGLSIAKVIVEKHGGDIGFDSQLNRGTRFFFDLPQLSRIDRNKALFKQNNSLHTGSILIIEDDTDVARLLQSMLEESGYNTEIAYSLTQAKALLQQQPDRFEAISLDIVLSDGDGIEFICELKQQDAFQNIKVVIVSAIADDRKAKLSGSALYIADWINKPFTRSRLLSSIESCINNEVKSLLHVEDDNDIHQIIRTMLIDKVRLSHAPSLEEAKKLLTRQHFDIVILDVSLPDGSGIDLLDDIQQHSPQTKVIVFSSQDIDKSIARRVDTILNKSKVESLSLLESILGL